MHFGREGEIRLWLSLMLGGVGMDSVLSTWQVLAGTWEADVMVSERDMGEEEGPSHIPVLSS